MQGVHVSGFGAKLLQNNSWKTMTVWSYRALIVDGGQRFDLQGQGAEACGLRNSPGWRKKQAID
jgi:hypothetical protein